MPSLYDTLTPWYRLVDPTSDHLDEATVYGDALARAADPRPETLLELGSGAGNNAFFLAQRFRCTLTDRSPEMLALSRQILPLTEHLLGDMLTLRLGRTFDAVLIHDAIMYMTTEADLRAAVETAFVHTRPGGSALFAPDYVRESFREATNPISGDEGGRSLRGLEWAWDPDPLDDTYRVDYMFLLREAGDVRSVHDRHTEGLFSRATWISLLTEVGYHAELVDRPLDDGTADQVFVCRRPG
jgi:SAM-dependent methyltransferase